MFYLVAKFVLPTINDLKFPTIKYDEKYEYLQEEKEILLKLNNAF